MSPKNTELKFLIIFLFLIFAPLVSCTNSQPVISYGFIQLVLYQGETGVQEHFSFFVLAEDNDGLENLDELYLYSDREQLRWKITSEDWLHHTQDGKNWIGSKSIAVQNGSLPRGVYRAVLVNKGGQSAERSFIYDGVTRFAFPVITVTEGEYNINSQWPVNRFVTYDSAGNYISTVTLSSLSGRFSDLYLPSSVRTAALWAEDENNFLSAFTNVVPVN